MIVLHEGLGGKPYCVHTMNLITGCFSNGAYCSDMIVATAVFTAR
jgi:hypothetical protein